MKLKQTRQPKVAVPNTQSTSTIEKIGNIIDDHILVQEMDLTTQKGKQK